ncbi:MAG: hypothetical protein HY445_01910 [Candidatus Niyogibacteria bacterium]|nr:hypothetical protein [Candidatus Niyogibacteria bacterium]
MEKLSKEELTPKNEERKLSFEEQLVLAKALFHGVDKRNMFIEGHGGFDTFAEAWQHVGDNRAVYDELEAAVTRARQELDEKIPDKKVFVGQLSDAGHEDLAKRIARMFGVAPKTQKVSKSGLFSRFRRKT